MEFRLDEGALEYIRQGGLERSVSIDIEATADAIEAVAGLRLLDGQTYSSRTTGSRSAMLQDLDRLCDGAEFVVGHNVTAHDLPEIGKRAPELALLRLPAIDTLVLSPIAFPQRPYHRLVKPYKTPGLERLQVNDPLIDAGTTALLLGDICKTLQGADPTRLAAWHWLLTREPGPDGYERLFARIRGAPRPEEDEGIAATLKAMDGLGCPKSTKGLARAPGTRRSSPHGCWPGRAWHKPAASSPPTSGTGTRQSGPWFGRCGQHHVVIRRASGAQNTRTRNAS